MTLLSPTLVKYNMKEGECELDKHYFRPTAQFPLEDGPLFIFVVDVLFSFLLEPEERRDSRECCGCVCSGLRSDISVKDSISLKKSLISPFYSLKLTDFQNVFFSLRE